MANIDVLCCAVLCCAVPPALHCTKGAREHSMWQRYRHTGMRTWQPSTERAEAALEAREAPTQAQVSSREALAMNGCAAAVSRGRYWLHSKPAPCSQLRPCSHEQTAAEDPHQIPAAKLSFRFAQDLELPPLPAAALALLITTLLCASADNLTHKSRSLQLA